MKSLIALCLALAACGDDRVVRPDATPYVPVSPDGPVVDAPIMTWEDAWRVWAGAWCRFTAYCRPEHFAYKYPDGYDSCVISVTALNCEYSASPCSSPYESTRLGALAQCESTMDNLACISTQIPLSCIAAFL